LTRVRQFFGFNMPLRIAYDFGQTATTYARRHRLYLALDGAFELSLGSFPGSRPPPQSQGFT
jgi:hypothetical protein